MEKRIVDQRKLHADLQVLLRNRPEQMTLNAAGWVVRVARVNDRYEVKFPWLADALMPEALHAYTENENGKIPVEWTLIRMIDAAIQRSVEIAAPVDPDKEIARIDRRIQTLTVRISEARREIKRLTARRNELVIGAAE